MSEKLCLQWNDFKENVRSGFGILREDKDFADVTLACEDGKQFEAHKVILATSSPFFQNILRRNKHSHPLIYMRGLKSEDLSAIIDFLYFGEANVFQENLDSFLAIAEDLQLKGLMGKTNDNEVEPEEEKPKTRKINKVYKQESYQRPKTQLTVVEQGTSVATEDLRELDNQINSMMVKTSRKLDSGHPFYQCSLCGKEAHRTNLKSHIEAKHLEGTTIPCNHCEKTFRSRNVLATHNSRQHNTSKHSDLF